MNIDYSMAAPSMAHVYGNVTSFVTEYIKQLFPENQFRTVYINTTIAYRNFAKFNINTNREFFKKRKPMLIVKPRLEIDTSDAFLDGTLFTTRITDMVDPREWGNLQDFILDKKNALYIKFLMNRLIMYYDVSLVYETQMRQINHLHYLKNRVRQNAPFNVSTNLESMIGRDMIILLTKLAGIECVNGDEMDVPKIMDYLNRHAVYPVTYKMKDSVGREEFFRYHPANIELTFSNLDIDGGDKTGQITDNFFLNFTVRAEFSTAGMYYLFSGKKAIEDKYKDFGPDSGSSASGVIVPMFTSKGIFDAYVPDGWNVYMCPTFHIDPSDPKPYILDVENNIFNESLKACAEYHRKFNIPMSTFIDLKAIKNNRVMSLERKEYEILWESNPLSIKVYNWNPAATYRLLVSVNTIYINELIGRIFGKDEEK